MIARLRIAIGNALIALGKRLAPALPPPSAAELAEQLERQRLQQAIARESAGQQHHPFRLLSTAVEGLWKVADEKGYRGPRATIELVAWITEQLRGGRHG